MSTVRVCAHVAAQLAEHGWCVHPDFIDMSLRDALAAETREHWQRGTFRHAGVGRGKTLTVRPEIRSDRVLWIDPAACSVAQTAYLRHIETLRVAINRALYLGLFDFEGHLAIYPPGSFYRKHVDRFADNSRRTVSAVLYLNDDWQVADGGQLRLYNIPGTAAQPLDVPPVGGTLVTFLSDHFPHEVLPATRERLSLTGWFRTREGLG